MPLNWLVERNAVVCEEPWSVIFKAGLFYACNSAIGVELAMRPNTMLLSFKNAAEAIDAYCGAKDEGADVIPIRGVA
jgi:hypothetical protein